MAATTNIRSTLDWAVPFVRFQPMTIGGQEPALTAANMTLQIILGPPFSWRWNRNTATFTCVPANPGVTYTLNEIEVTSNVVTVYLTDGAAKPPVGMPFVLNDVSSLPALNGETVEVTASAPGQFSFAYTLDDQTPIPTTGQAVNEPTLAVQDYTVAISDFGFEEVASVADTTGLNKEITFKKVLALDGSTPDRAAYIAVQNDDNEGNITFRISPPPDQAYVATVTYQRKPPPILSLAGTWTPVPDEYAYIYNWGFITMAAMLINDQRMAAYSQKFVGHLLGAQSGLSERQINIFMSTYLQRTGQVAVAGMMAQQGVTARTF
jgi:hypothetical protein